VDDLERAVPLTISQINRLGRRLRESERVSERDLADLQSLRADHFDMLVEVQQLLRDELPGSSPTSRLKTIQTIVDKLKRERTMALSRMQDIAGIRIVEDMNVAEQTVLVRQIAEVLARVGSVAIIDRRVRPSSGYRAVHVVVERGRRFVEVQIRTTLQDQWAQIVERLGDRWGRQIRYGDPPPNPEQPVGIGAVTRGALWETVLTISNLIDECEASVAGAVSRHETTPEEVSTLMRNLQSTMEALHTAAVTGRL
jgi:hypothetical protein